jgi:outer membrane protein TolC
VVAVSLKKVFFKQKTAYEILSSDWSSDVCSSDLDIAQRSWEAARRRYDSGVGNILELMSTQASLANARQRHVQALADWGSARVDLASKLGWLRAADLRGEGQEAGRGKQKAVR